MHLGLVMLIAYAPFLFWMVQEGRETMKQVEIENRKGDNR